MEGYAGECNSVLKIPSSRMRPFGGTVADKSASQKLREAIEKLQENVWSGRKGTVPFCQLGCKTKLPR